MDTEKYKKELLEEKMRLEEQMGGVGQVNPSNPEDWEPTPAKDDQTYIDENERADVHEESMERSAILTELELRYNNVTDALEKIEKGTYGICEVSGEKIEEERLEANPAARTCLKHMDQEKK